MLYLGHAMHVYLPWPKGRVLWELSGKTEELVQTVMLLGSNSKKEKKTRRESVVEMRIQKIFLMKMGVYYFH